MAWDLPIPWSVCSRVVAGGTLSSPHPAKPPMKDLPGLVRLTTSVSPAVLPISRASRAFSFDHAFHATAEMKPTPSFGALWNEIRVNILSENIQSGLL
ncbi:hypothetical protein JTB14_016144 [Gonioctena quinquepunctata]|nr:hypothetical protein JTB14_016144 [Gonioctena quinquepunctata]